MSWALAEIYRHPVKSLGEEALDEVTLAPGRPVPWDRVWAIAHGGSDWSPAAPKWAVPGNFVNQTHVPQLARIAARFDEATGVLTLAHPDRPELEVSPGTEEGNAALTRWIAPLARPARHGPYRICQAPGIAFTDFEDTHVSVATVDSRRALEKIAGRTLEPIRFRMNLWLEGPAPWADLDWVGREIEIGAARLKVIARDTRCNATNASPVTGERDTQIPATLRKTFGHLDFGVYAQVVQGGRVARGDAARLV